MRANLEYFYLKKSNRNTAVSLMISDFNQSLIKSLWLKSRQQQLNLFKHKSEHGFAEIGTKKSTRIGTKLQVAFNLIGEFVIFPKYFREKFQKGKIF